MVDVNEFDAPAVRPASEGSSYSDTAPGDGQGAAAAPSSPRTDAYDDEFDAESAGGSPAVSPRRAVAAAPAAVDEDYGLGAPLVRDVPLRRSPAVLVNAWASPAGAVTLLARTSGGERRVWRGELPLDEVTRHCAREDDGGGGQRTPSIIGATRALNGGCTAAEAAALLVASFADVDDGPGRVRASDAACAHPRASDVARRTGHGVHGTAGTVADGARRGGVAER